LEQRPGSGDDVRVVAHGIESVEADGSARGGAKPQQGLDDGGLPGPVWSEQAGDLAVSNVKRDVVDGAQITEGDLQIRHFDSVTHDI